LKRGRQPEYAALIAEAEQAEPFRSLIDPRAAEFIKPGNMPERIVRFCVQSGQPAPETPGQFVRCILESLSLLYRVTLEEIEQLTGRSIRRLHIVGGGSQNVLLNEFATNATNRRVIAGPVEATAIGNVLIQAMALGDVKSLTSLRRIVRDSFALRTYEPSLVENWQPAYDRFLELHFVS
jgi:rhamnulokinase